MNVRPVTDSGQMMMNTAYDTSAHSSAMVSCSIGGSAETVGFWLCDDGSGGIGHDEMDVCRSVHAAVISERLERD